MKHPETYLVTAQNGARPAGYPDACFYCDRPVGEMHHPDCVLRQRTVVLRGGFDLTVTVPDNWTEHDILFWANEGAQCADNQLKEFVRLTQRDGCSCARLTFEVAREATEVDEIRDQIEVLEPAPGAAATDAASTPNSETGEPTS
jgi:hypothetical protein